MDTMGSRLRAAMDEKGWKPDDLVRRKILSRAGVYQWLGDSVRPDKVRAETIGKLSRALGIDSDWLQYGRGAMRPAMVVRDSEAPSYLQDTNHVDVLGFAQAAGLSEGVEAEEYAETHHLKFRADSLARKNLKPRDLAVMYGRGDSMEPRIHSGDAILFDQGDTRPRDGHLYVVLVPGVGAESYSVKRCEVIDDLVFFRADNPRGDHGWRKPRRMDDPKRPIKVIGRVRWIGSWEG